MKVKLIVLTFYTASIFDIRKFWQEVISNASFTVPVLGLWMGIVAFIFGIIVMISPKIFNYLIGIYLIIIGVLAIIASSTGNKEMTTHGH